MKKIALSLALIALFAVPLVSGATMTGKGDNMIVANPPVTTELPDGRSYVSVSNRQTLTADDPKHPFNRAVIECAGGCLMKAGSEGGKCMGSCTGLDRDGDMIFFLWDGQPNVGGNWYLQGGSGKFKGATGTGPWTDAGAIGAGFTHNLWEGTIEMK